MAGKPGMHTKVMHPARVNEMREKIKATLIVKKLEEHILDGTEMSSSQVTAALGLLKKAIPDLSSVELANAPGETFKSNVVLSAEESYKLLLAGNAK